MEPTNTKFYQLGNGGSLVCERDLDALSEYLECPHPEFHGTQVNDQPGGELQWVITADLRGKMEPPTSERILFSIRKQPLDGLARALQKHLPRAKKEATIARLRAKIVSLEATVKAQEDQLREMEDEGEDIQEGEAFLSDDDDFEEDENTDVEDYEFLEAGEDDFIPIDVDDEE
ncbi:hypothetical protein QYE76_064904 [Lolium multiflorum]|uniref:Uncharacterized protein n=1 Tax=Lolium multiflorum TaxID=4521 RepID=A0AAD8S7S4_LOLMU|nr:hypothetical protein QYE76_064904 [Lolium multiflorum]